MIDSDLYECDEIRIAAQKEIAALTSRSSECATQIEWRKICVLMTSFRDSFCSLLTPESTGRRAVGKLIKSVLHIFMQAERKQAKKKKSNECRRQSLKVGEGSHGVFWTDVEKREASSLSRFN